MKKVNENVDNIQNVKIVLIGNKIDLINERKISREEAIKVAEEHKIKYFETSAKDDIGIKGAINEIVKDILENKKEEKIEVKNNNEIILEKEKNDNEGNNENNCYSYC